VLWARSARFWGHSPDPQETAQLAGLQRCGTCLRRDSQPEVVILSGKKSWSRHADSNCGPAVYETAALPLSYVGRSASIGDAPRRQLFAARGAPSGSYSPASTTLEQLMIVSMQRSWLTAFRLDLERPFARRSDRISGLRPEVQTITAHQGSGRRGLLTHYRSHIRRAGRAVGATRPGVDLGFDLDGLDDCVHPVHPRPSPVSRRRPRSPGRGT
jgi:hypothetical protein